MPRKTPFPRIRALACLAVGSVALLASQEAEASGFSTARFGGEHGHVASDNPTTIYYNPAGIAVTPGTRIFVDVSTVFRWASYERPKSAVNTEAQANAAPGANDGRASLFNVLAAPMGAISSDFGTKGRFAMGAGVYFPFGGQASWNENEDYAGDETYPGAVDGQQRWYTIDGTIRSMYITGAVAFSIPEIGLSLGFSGSAIRSEVNTIRARNADGTDDLTAGDPAQLKEGRSLIDVEGWQAGFGVGATWQWKNKLWIGASYTSQPNVVGGMRLRGKLSNALTVAQPEDTDVEFLQTLPDIYRFGFRVRPIEKLELRAFADVTRWSVFDRQCVVNSPGASCDFSNKDTAFSDPDTFGVEVEEGTDAGAVTQHLPRFWRDTGGVRVGASWWFIPQLETYVGAGYDGNAVPRETIDAALMDMHKATLSLGARWQIIKQLAVSATATQIIYVPVDTNDESLLNEWQSPTRQPSGDGVYRQFISLLTIFVDVAVF